MRLHEAGTEFVETIAIARGLIGLVEARAHHELLRKILRMVFELEDAGDFLGIQLSGFSTGLVDAAIGREWFLLDEALEDKLFASVGEGVAWNDLVVVAAQRLRFVNVLVPKDVQLRLDSLISPFLLCFSFFLDEEDLLGLKIGETDRELDFVLDREPFILAVDESFRSEVVVLDPLQGLVRKIKHVQAVLVVWALDLYKLLGLGQARVLSNDDVRVGQLIWRVELILEHLSEHDALVEPFDLQPELVELVLENAAVHFLDIPEGVRGLDVVVL